MEGWRDRQTDSFLMARPRCMQCMKRGKNEVVHLQQTSVPSSCYTLTVTVENVRIAADYFTK